MGISNVIKLKSKKDKSEYFHRLIKDIEALEMMLEKGMIEKFPIRIGAEQEFFILNNEFLPNNNSLELLENINDPHFTTEIGNYNLEINLDPIELKGDCFSRMYEQLTSLLLKANDVAREFDSKILLTGILPTLSQKHITLDNMTKVKRYAVLNKVAMELRDQDISIHIKGVDEITLLHDSILLEGCNTSFQMHLQINPDEFIDSFNWAQAIAGPVLAVCCNSPLLFGKELWNETRISLFSQSVDIRANSYLLNESQSRVSFENHWHTGSISDIFKDNIARFRCLLTAESIEDSLEVLENGGVPKLNALGIHNGTVYRWNRACYGVGGGKPHLRIENRYIPAGPTRKDEVANMAFWVGLMRGRTKECDKIHEVMDFKDANSNFYSAARYGMKSQFFWDGQLVSSQKLILEKFLPMAYEGLRSMGVLEKDIVHYLSIIEKRVSAQTGADWMVRSYRNLLSTKKRNESLQVLTANMYLNQEKEIPVSDWEILKSNATTTFNIKKKVHHVMNTDIFSIEEKDSLELAVYLMKWKKIHHMPVIKNDKELVGLITWTDIEKYHDREDIDTIPVGKVMTRSLVSISQEMDFDEAKELMNSHNFNCLPVVKDNKLIGIVTSNDM